jgi:hypothetical protein
MSFKVDHLLTVGTLKKILSSYSDDTVITVAGDEEVVIKLEYESKVTPQILSFDSSDVVVAPSDQVIWGIQHAVVDPTLE